MKLTLTITGSPSALASVLALIPKLPSGDGDDVTIHSPIMPEVAAVTQPQAIGGAIPLPPAAPATAPVGSAPVSTPAPVIAPPPASTEADEDGPADANAPATDTTGLPWDERIHAKSKALNADGSWRSRRNLDAATKASVEAELRGAAHVASTPPAPVPPMPAVAPAPVMAPPPPPPVAEPAPLAAPVQAATVASAEPPTDIASFMTQLQEQMKNTGPDGAPLITPDYLNNLTQRINQAAQVNMASISGLADQPHLIPYAVQVMRDVDKTWR